MEDVGDEGESEVSACRVAAEDDLVHSCQHDRDDGDLMG